MDHNVSKMILTFPNKRKYAWIQAFLVVGGSGNACFQTYDFKYI